jgi:hypothetical protein
MTMRRLLSLLAVAVFFLSAGCATDSGSHDAGAGGAPPKPPAFPNAGILP